MVSYADTSLLVSLYVKEATSSVALEIVGGLPLPLPITPLLELEFHNALNLRLWRKEITAAQHIAAMRKFETDCNEGLLQREQVADDELFRKATQLSDRHTPTIGTRSLDLLHVAAALLLNASELLTFDERQRRMAEAAGLAVRPQS